MKFEQEARKHYKKEQQKTKFHSGILADIIEAMLEKIPQEESSFRARLEDIHGSLMYQAPEAYPPFLALTAEALEDHVDIDSEDGWQFEVKTIWFQSEIYKDQP